MAGQPSNSNNPQELLNCGICEEPYDGRTHEAKFLSCHHTFCFDCLNKLSNQGQVNPAIIKCPNCRCHTRVPENGVYGLRGNFYIASLQEFSEKMEPPRSAANFQCVHGHDTRAFFCVTCGLSICRDCTSADHKAKGGHFVISITKTEISYIEELSVSQKSLNTNKRNQQIIEYELALLTVAKENVIKDIDTCIKSSQEQLEQRRNDLVNQISDQFNVRQKSLLDKQEEIVLMNRALNDNINQAKRITKTGDLDELKPISESLRKINEKTNSISSDLDLGENYLVFDSNKGSAEIKHSLCNLGQVYSKGFLPSGIAFRNTKAKAGHKALLSVEVYNHHGDKVAVSPGCFSFEVTDTTDTKLRTFLSTDSPGCTLTFTPQKSGLHKVSGMFLGHELISEQTHISVRSNDPVLTFGDLGEGNGAFNSPWGIAIDSSNCVYVADVNNKLIQKFSAGGEFLNQFSVAVNDNDHTACDIALDINRGLILSPKIIDLGDCLRPTNQIQVFDLDGKLQNTYTPSKTYESFFIAIDGHGDSILCDEAEKCLFKVDKAGKFVGSMGHLVSPGHIAIDDDGVIIVPEEDNDCVVILNPDGSVRHKFGSPGAGNGQMRQPNGVAADGEYILVSEIGNSRVQVFTYDGAFVSMIRDPLIRPRGLALTKDGHVYVADSRDNSIKKYRYKDMS